MGALLIPLFSALASILPGAVGDYFKMKREIELTNAQTMQLIAQAKQKMAAEIAKADAQRAIVALKSTSPVFKYIVFGLIATPFVSCLIGWPAYAQMVFANLNTLPEWYNVIFTGIIAVIWGIPVDGSIMNLVFQGISNASHNRRMYKITKDQGFDAARFYDSIRKSVFLKGMTQYQVDAFNKAIKDAGATEDTTEQGNDQ